jgi:hypothetical protein
VECIRNIDGYAARTSRCAASTVMSMFWEAKGVRSAGWSLAQSQGKRRHSRKHLAGAAQGREPSEGGSGTHPTYWCGDGRIQNTNISRPRMILQASNPHQIWNCREVPAVAKVHGRPRTGGRETVRRAGYWPPYRHRGFAGVFEIDGARALPAGECWRGLNWSTSGGRHSCLRD